MPGLANIFLSYAVYQKPEFSAFSWFIAILNESHSIEQCDLTDLLWIPPDGATTLAEAFCGDLMKLVKKSYFTGPALFMFLSKLVEFFPHITEVTTNAGNLIQCVAITWKHIFCQDDTCPVSNVAVIGPYCAEFMVYASSILILHPCVIDCTSCRSTIDIVSERKPTSARARAEGRGPVLLNILKILYNMVDDGRVCILTLLAQTATRMITEATEDMVDVGMSSKTQTSTILNVLQAISIMS